MKLDEIIDLTVTWLVTGDLNIEMLAEDFTFVSPFWKTSRRQDFIDQFQKSSKYKDDVLSKIVKFDPLIKFKSVDGDCFSIVLQYHTRNGSAVDEAVFGRIRDGLLVELRSIYDLADTKKALELHS